MSYLSITTKQLDEFMIIIIRYNYINVKKKNLKLGKSNSYNNFLNLKRPKTTPKPTLLNDDE